MLNIFVFIEFSFVFNLLFLFNIFSVIFEYKFESKSWDICLHLIYFFLTISLLILIFSFLGLSALVIWIFSLIFLSSIFFGSLLFDCLLFFDNSKWVKLGVVFWYKFLSLLFSMLFLKLSLVALLTGEFCWFFIFLDNIDELFVALVNVRAFLYKLFLSAIFFLFISELFLICFDGWNSISSLFVFLLKAFTELWFDSFLPDGFLFILLFFWVLLLVLFWAKIFGKSQIYILLSFKTFTIFDMEPLVWLVTNDSAFISSLHLFSFSSFNCLLYMDIEFWLINKVSSLFLSVSESKLFL